MFGKKGAVELSIGTIVIIVLAMSMLILGLVLVKKIFSGSTDNVDQINEGVRGRIGKLFGEDSKIVVSLTGKKASIKQGEAWGVGFGIKNTQRGTSEASSFSSVVSVNDPDEVQSNCGIRSEVAEKWIRTGRKGSLVIAPGQSEVGLVRFLIPSSAPLCFVRFKLEVTADSTPYATDYFDVEVLPA